MRRLLLILAFLGSNSLALERAPSSIPSKVQSQAFVLSTSFEPNVGQFDAGTLFFARVPGYDVVLTSNGVAFAPRNAWPDWVWPW